MHPGGDYDALVDAPQPPAPSGSRAWLIVGWVAVLGSDRIDLLGGAASFKLVPLYVLTALVVLSEWTRRVSARNLPRPTREQWGFVALVLLLLTLVAGSVMRSVEIGISTNRALLLASITVGISLAIWGASDRPDLSALLARGARAGLVLASLFNVAQLLQFFSVLPRWVRVGPVLITLESQTYGIFPRLSGASPEMNGAAAVFLVFLVLIAVGTPAIRFRRGWLLLGAATLLATLSRSGILATVISLALLPRLSSFSRTARAGAALALGALALGAALLLNDGARDTTARALAPLAGRFDPTEGSAQSHAMLMQRGLTEATRGVPRTLLGIGYGSSYRALADVFPGNKYGNFHTAYFQLWVEVGIFALVLFLLLLALSVLRGGVLTGVVVGFAAYNVFFEGFSHPALWLVLAVIWFAPEVTRRGLARRPWYLPA